jgi:hypothetical protein
MLWAYAASAASEVFTANFASSRVVVKGVSRFETEANPILASPTQERGCRRLAINTLAIVPNAAIESPTNKGPCHDMCLIKRRLWFAPDLALSLLLF